MQNKNSNIENLNSLITLFDDRNLDKINLTEIKNDLMELREYISSHESNLYDLSLLQEDYRSRIAGMIKGMAVAKRNRDSLETALIKIEELKKMTAAELISEYKKTSARFRGFFPSSQFNYGSNDVSDSSKKR